MKRFTNYSRLIVILAYIVGVVGISIKIDNPQYYRVTAFFVPMSFLMLMLFHKPHSIKFWFTIVVVGFAGFLVEAIGTNTGLIFGSYQYGKSMGFGLFGTPLNMAINWMMLVYLVAFMLQNWRVGNMLKSLVSAIALTTFDWVLEPVAIRLDMWSWDTGTPPLHNYVGWFIFSFMMFTFYYRFAPKSQNSLAFLFGVMHGLFFISLNLIFRLI